MRSLPVTVVGALVIACAVTTSAWAIQAAFLPPPERGDLAALNAVAQLARHNLVDSSLSVDGGRALHGRCLTGWYPRRGQLLQLGHDMTILAAGRHDLAVKGDVPGAPVADLLLAGCPRVLVRTVDRLLQSGTATSEARAWFERPALAVKLRERTGVQLTLYVSPGRDVLLGVRIRGPRMRGLSHVIAGRR